MAQGGRDPNDNKRMVATPAAPLAPGSYLVEWTTTSADDGELARGTWTFYGRPRLDTIADAGRDGGKLDARGGESVGRSGRDGTTVKRRPERRCHRPMAGPRGVAVT